MPRQFEVFPHPIAARREFYFYIVVLQHQGFRLGTDIIAAPLAAPARALASRVLPTLEIEGRSLQLITHEMSPIARRLLKRPLASLEADRRRIIDAIDMLFVGS